MAPSLDFIIDDEEFKRHHSKQVHHRSQKDIFFIWMLIVFISVIAANFILGLASGSPTGFVTAETSTTTDATIILGSMMLVFVMTLMVALVYTGITKKDH
jgi:hypothetical protein